MARSNRHAMRSDTTNQSEPHHVSRPGFAICRPVITINKQSELRNVSYKQGDTCTIPNTGHELNMHGYNWKT